MSGRIILPNGNGSSRSLKRGSDFVTMDELVQLIGPQAKLLMEFHDRLSILENQHGIASPQADDAVSSPSGDVD